LQNPNFKTLEPTGITCTTKSLIYCVIQVQALNMATPGNFNNPAQQAKGLKDPHEKEAFEEGHDADVPVGLSGAFEKDLEAGAKPPSLDSTDNIKAAEEPLDPNTVWWDGPDDPTNPMNWTDRKKWTNIAIVSLITLITYVLLHEVQVRVTI
jgi:hypothetical protein